MSRQAETEREIKRLQEAELTHTATICDLLDEIDSLKQEKAEAVQILKDTYDSGRLGYGWRITVRAYLSALDAPSKPKSLAKAMSEQPLLKTPKPSKPSKPACKTCGGSGNGTQCPKCGGSGESAASLSEGEGWPGCEVCKGTGMVPPCPDCNGTGIEGGNDEK